MTQTNSIVYSFAGLYTTEEGAILVNVKNDEEKVNLVFLMECPSKHQQPESVQRQLKGIKAFEEIYANSGVISGRLEYSGTLKRVEGNLCTFTMQPDGTDGTTASWTLRVVEVSLHEGDGCFPYRCYHDD